ncbi:MAG: GspMb/PilO family protein [Kiritimatiellales bacterium]
MKVNIENFKHWFNRLSRRERIYVFAGAAVLFVFGVMVPLWNASENYRAGKLEELEAARRTRDSYRAMLQFTDAIQNENAELLGVTAQTDGLLFDRTGNDVMMEAAMVKLLNQMAPDMGLEISMGRPSLRAPAGQLTFSVRGTGRYPDILNFFYQLETHRPLIVIDQFNLALQNMRQRDGGMPATLMQRPAPTASSSSSPAEPRIRLQMTIHINCRTAS